MDINRGADDQMLVLAAAAVAIDEEQLQRVRNRRADKEMWVRAWLIRRPLQGHYDNLMRELNREDRDEYVQFLRVLFVRRESFFSTEEAVALPFLAAILNLHFSISFAR